MKQHFTSSDDRQSSSDPFLTIVYLLARHFNSDGPETDRGTIRRPQTMIMLFQTEISSRVLMYPPPPSPLWRVISGMHTYVNASTCARDVLHTCFRFRTRKSVRRLSFLNKAQVRINQSSTCFMFPLTIGRLSSFAVIFSAWLSNLCLFSVLVLTPTPQRPHTLPKLYHVSSRA